MRAPPIVVVLVVVLLLPSFGPTVRAEEKAEALRLLDRFEVVAEKVVDIREISALAALEEPGTFLVVSDEGPYDAEHRTVDGALFHLALGRAAGDADRITPITLHVEIERFDPAWPAGVSPFDLESLAPLPGTKDLYLLGGERNPEDQTDDGANRLYVVRYPAPDQATARVVAYFRLYDLPDDGFNDRFEGLAVQTAPGAEAITTTAGAWNVYAFKERTAFPDRAPAYVRGRLTLADGVFALEVHGDRGYPPLSPDFLLRDPERIGSQSDACVAPDGSIWVLDRWRRQIHVAEASGEGGALVHRETLDHYEVVKDIPGETSALEPAPPGLPERRGYGRHEAIAFDRTGRLHLASDRGGSAPSTLTILAPRQP